MAREPKSKAEKRTKDDEWTAEELNLAVTLQIRGLLKLLRPENRLQVLKMVMEAEKFMEKVRFRSKARMTKRAITNEHTGDSP